MCKERPMPRRRHNLGLGWLVAATALVGCGSPQAGWADDAWARDLPPWALQPQEAYPEAQYMSAIGSGRTMDQAERDALRRLAQRFRVMLDSVETQLDDYIAQVGDQIPGTDWEETTNLLSTIRLRSTLELLNARIAERAVSEDGRYAFALAVVERRPTARLYERQMEINRQAAETHFALAEELPMDRKLRRLGHLRTAWFAAKAHRDLQHIRDVLVGPMGFEMDGLDYGAIESAYESARDSVSARPDWDPELPRALRDEVESSLSRLGLPVTRGDDADLVVQSRFDVELIESETYRFVEAAWRMTVTIRDGSTEAQVLFLDYEGVDGGRDRSRATRQARIRAAQVVRERLRPDLAAALYNDPTR
jgi:hypothetical protein